MAASRRIGAGLLHAACQLRRALKRAETAAREPRPRGASPRVPLCGARVHFAAAMRRRLRRRASAWTGGKSFATEAAEEPDMPLACRLSMLRVCA